MRACMFPCDSYLGYCKASPDVRDSPGHRELFISEVGPLVTVHLASESIRREN